MKPTPPKFSVAKCRKMLIRTAFIQAVDFTFVTEINEVIKAIQANSSIRRIKTKKKVRK